VSKLSYSQDERAVADELAEVSGRHAPRPDWQARVWARALRQHTAQPHRPWWTRRWVAGFAVLSLVCAGVLVGVVLNGRDAERREQELVAQLEQVEKEKKAIAAEMAALQVELDMLAQEQAQLQKDLDSADSDAARDAIRRMISAKQREVDQKRRERERKRARRQSRERAKIKVKCDPKDPLCGV
jgi:hypothetical protein